VKILLIEDDIDIAASIADYLEYQAMSVDAQSPKTVEY
jgi:DNA-binding response OmpR family regulator